MPTLADLVNRLRGDLPTVPTPPPTVESNGRPPEGAVDLRHVRGQAAVKRALEVAAAGGHNLIMVGPPGAGKILAARALPGILPPLSPREALEVAKVCSVAGLLERDRPLMTRRPFRTPHHTTSHAGLVGGGQRAARPGEISLAQTSVQLCHQEKGSLPAAGAYGPLMADPAGRLAARAGRATSRRDRFLPVARRSTPT